MHPFRSGRGVAVQCRQPPPVNTPHTIHQDAFGDKHINAQLIGRLLIEGYVGPSLGCPSTMSRPQFAYVVVFGKTFVEYPYCTR